MKPKIMLSTVLAGTFAVFADIPNVTLDTSADRVESSLRVSLKRIGTLKPRAASEIEGSNWILGCETLDRDFADFEKYKQFIEPLGIKRIRLQCGWAKCEKVRGQYDFSWLDRIVNHCVAHGIKCILETGYGNPLYPGGGSRDIAGGFPTSEEALKAWDAWVAALVCRYRDRVVDWAMWNEPDWCETEKRTPEQIAVFNVRTAKIVRQYAPNAKISGLSLARNNSEYFETCLKAMGKDVDLFDSFTYHGYASAPEESYEEVEKQKAVLKKYNPKAVMRQGENGCPSELTDFFSLSNVAWSEYSQAKWDMRRMLGDLGHDVESAVFTICEFNHVLSNGYCRTNSKGILRADKDHNVIAIKRAYYAVQNVASIFDNTWKRVPETGIVEPDVTIEFYQYVNRAGLLLYVFWSTGGELKPYAKGHWDLSVEKRKCYPKYARPSDNFNTRPAIFQLAGATPIKNPVWVDLFTGRVYEFPKKDVVQLSGGTMYLNVPVYDSPCILMDRSALVSVELTKEN